jgi:hypothetical protein
MPSFEKGGKGGDLDKFISERIQCQLISISRLLWSIIKKEDANW